MAGLSLEAASVKLWLGVLLVLVVILTVVTTREKRGAVSPAAQEDYSDWWPERRAVATAMFFGIGFLGGLFGIGAGWANVPLLVAVCGAPLRVAAATSGLVILANSAAASWVYLSRGAVDPLLTVAAVAGMSLGSRLGARLLHRVPQKLIKWVVLVLLTVAAARSIVGGV